jgi:hypothetical protein
LPNGNCQVFRTITVKFQYKKSHRAGKFGFYIEASTSWCLYRDLTVLDAKKPVLISRVLQGDSYVKMFDCCFYEKCQFLCFLIQKSVKNLLLFFSLQKMKFVDFKSRRIKFLVSLFT